MSWPWIVLLVLAVVVVASAEWARVGRVVGTDARKVRQREKRKASLTLITNDPDSDDFAQSVQRDLDALPTIDEPRSNEPR